MADLISISGIGQTSRELLAAAGLHDVESLASASAAELAHELNQLNATLQITKRPPSQHAIEKWLVAARDMVACAEQPAPLLVNYEQSPQVIEMLADAPFAIPLASQTLLDNQLQVTDISAAILLNRYAGDLDVKVHRQTPSTLPVIPPAAPSAITITVSNNNGRAADNDYPRLDLDLSKRRATTDLNVSQIKQIPTPNQAANDRIALLRAPRQSTNKGRNPQSRWYIRGVLHSNPYTIFLGALVTLLLMIITPLAVISATLLLLSSERPESFAWVPKWLLAFPAAVPVLGIGYLIWGLGGNCRICAQKLFVYRPHFKNSRAHKLWIFGHILPLCIHILLFRWFRCTHCGTPVRLKQ